MSPSNWSQIAVRLLPGLLIGGGAFMWAVWGLAWGPVWQQIRPPSPLWLAISLLSVLAVTGAKAARWGSLFNNEQQPRPSFSNLFAVLVAAQLANLLVPVRLGEIIRMGLLKAYRQPVAITFPTIVLEKTVDLIATGLVGTALVSLIVAPVWLSQSIGRLLGLGLGLGLALVIAWWQRQRLVAGFEQMLRRLPGLPTRWQRALLEFGQTFLQSLHTLANRRSLGQIALWTLLIWGLALLAMVALLAAFDLALPLTAAALLMLATSVSNIFPSPPALVGLMQGIAVAVLGFYGVAQPLAFSVGVWLNLITVLPLLVLGCWGWWQQAGPLANVSVFAKVFFRGKPLL